MDERRYHDMGGLTAGPVEASTHDAEPWQKLLTASRNALGDRYCRVDELRRAIEDLPAAQYDLPYFEKWACALANLYVEKGLFTREELTAKMDAVRRRMREAA
ncbi:MAG: hypothetical protein AB7K86_01670 [Rhodospirillales bacterium]